MRRTSKEPSTTVMTHSVPRQTNQLIMGFVAYSFIMRPSTPENQQWRCQRFSPIYRVFRAIGGRGGCSNCNRLIRFESDTSAPTSPHASLGQGDAPERPL